MATLMKTPGTLLVHSAPDAPPAARERRRSVVLTTSVTLTTVTTTSLVTALICATLALVGCNRDAGPDPAPGAAPGAASGDGAATASAGAPDDDGASDARDPAARTPPPGASAGSVNDDPELLLLLGLAAPEPLRIDDLVTADDVRTITGFNDDLRAEALVGQATGPQYNSLHLERADGQLGFTLQVWLPGELRLARDQFERLRRTAFSEAQRVEAGNEAFTSETPTSIELTLVDYRSGAVIILGCARGLCNPSHLIRLSSLVVSRLAGSE